MQHNAMIITPGLPTIWKRCTKFSCKILQQHLLQQRNGLLFLLHSIGHKNGVVKFGKTV